MNDHNVEAWRFPALLDYFDAASAAPERLAAALGELDEAARSDALEGIRSGVHAHVEGMDPEVFTEIAVASTDDLYKFGCQLTFWGDWTQAYVDAAWGTYYSDLAVSGIQIRYVIENTYPDGLLRPLQLFPILYAATGMTYVSPHAIALELAEDLPVQASLQDLEPYVAEARVVAEQAVRELNNRRRHFTYLEIDFVEGSLDAVQGLPAAPGTIDIFRNEAPLPGSEVQVRVHPNV